MATARSPAAITGNIAWVSLDPELHALLLAEPSRTALREELLVAWFGGRREALQAVLDDERDDDPRNGIALAKMRLPQARGNLNPHPC